MKITELRRLASAMGIKNPHKLNKVDLEREIEVKEDELMQKCAKPTTVNISEMTMKQLQELAKEYCLRVSRVSKEELMESIVRRNKVVPIHVLANTVITADQVSSATAKQLKKLIPRGAGGKSKCTRREDIAQLAAKYVVDSDVKELDGLLLNGVDPSEFSTEILHLHARRMGVKDVGQLFRADILELLEGECDAII